MEHKSEHPNRHHDLNADNIRTGKLNCLAPEQHIAGEPSSSVRFNLPESLMDDLYQQGFVPNDAWLDKLIGFLTEPAPPVAGQLILSCPVNSQPYMLDLLRSFCPPAVARMVARNQHQAMQYHVAAIRLLRNLRRAYPFKARTILWKATRDRMRVVKIRDRNDLLALMKAMLNMVLYTENPFRIYNLQQTPEMASQHLHSLNEMYAKGYMLPDAWMHDLIDFMVHPTSVLLEELKRDVPSWCELQLDPLMSCLHTELSMINFD